MPVIATSETYNKRLATCKACEHREERVVRVKPLSGCKKWNCSCPVNSKAWLQSTECPENKW